MSTTTLSATTPAQANSAHARPILVRPVTWKFASIVSRGDALLIAMSLGAIAGDFGPASIFVWSLIMGIGILRCRMIAEMASLYPNKSGFISGPISTAWERRPVHRPDALRRAARRVRPVQA